MKTLELSSQVALNPRGNDPLAQARMAALEWMRRNGKEILGEQEKPALDTVQPQTRHDAAR